MGLKTECCIGCIDNKDCIFSYKDKSIVDKIGCIHRRTKMEIEIEKDVKDFLDEWLYNDGTEAWYCKGIKLDLRDYNGAIKSIVNRLEFWRALAEGNIAPHIIFDSEIKAVAKEEYNEEKN